MSASDEPTSITTVLWALVVEPDAEVRRHIVQCVRECGYQDVLEAEGAETGMALAYRHLPDLLVVAGELPNGNGLEFVRTVEISAILPTILLVDEGVAEAEQKEICTTSLASRIVPCLQNSVTPEQMLNVIKLAKIFGELRAKEKTIEVEEKESTARLMAQMESLFRRGQGKIEQHTEAIVPSEDKPIEYKH